MENKTENVESLVNTCIDVLIYTYNENPYISVYSTTSVFNVINILLPDFDYIVVLYSEEEYRIYTVISVFELFTSIYELFCDAACKVGYV